MRSSRRPGWDYYIPLAIVSAYGRSNTIVVVVVVVAIVVVVVVEKVMFYSLCWDCGRTDKFKNISPRRTHITYIYIHIPR